ncbi:MAG: hypothetical protein ACI8ZA_002589 [Gammaproteobacteria bacterium]|jgi:hypothetical protein
MKPLSIILASLITTVALITYAAEQSEPEQKEPQVEAQASVEKPKVENEQSVTQTNTDDKVNTLEYKAPELKKPIIDATKPDDSKVLGNEQIKPAEKPKNKIEKQSL